MNFEVLLRDGLEFLIVIAVGAMAVSAIVRIRRGEIKPHYCESCERPISRAYAACPKCHAPQMSEAPQQ